MNKDEIAEKAAEEIKNGVFVYLDPENSRTDIAEIYEFILPIIAEACRKASGENERKLAALEVLCYFRPHPREWFNDEMKPENERAYNIAFNAIGKSLSRLDLQARVKLLTPKIAYE